MELKIKNREIKGNAIVKLSYGDKYIITKCRDIGWLEKEFRSTLRRYDDKELKRENFYYKFAKYIHSVDAKKVLCEIIYQTENGYDVLKKELELLIEHYGNKDCMNENNIPYIPKTIHAKKGSSWLKQNEFLNFMKLLKNYEY